MTVAKVHDAGENRIINILFGATPVDGAYYLGLYKNPTELAEDAVLSGLDEPSGGSYVRQVLTRGVANWTIVDDAATYATIKTFLSTAAWGDIWGYFIATSLNNTGVLIATEHFDAAYNIVSGKGIKIQPKITVG